MRKSKFTPHQIAKILKEFEEGKSSEEISREHGVSKAAFYKWRERYAGMSGKELKRIKPELCVRIDKRRTCVFDLGEYSIKPGPSFAR